MPIFYSTGCTDLPLSASKSDVRGVDSIGLQFGRRSRIYRRQSQQFRKAQAVSVSRTLYPHALSFRVCASFTSCPLWMLHSKSPPSDLLQHHARKIECSFISTTSPYQETSQQLLVVSYTFGPQCAAKVSVITVATIYVAERAIIRKRASIICKR